MKRPFVISDNQSRSREEATYRKADVDVLTVVTADRTFTVRSAWPSTLFEVFEVFGGHVKAIHMYH